MGGIGPTLNRIPSQNLGRKLINNGTGFLARGGRGKWAAGRRRGGRTGAHGRGRLGDQEHTGKLRKLTNIENIQIIEEIAETKETNKIIDDQEFLGEIEEKKESLEKN